MGSGCRVQKEVLLQKVLLQSTALCKGSGHCYETSAGVEGIQVDA